MGKRVATEATEPAGARDDSRRWLSGGLQGVWYAFNVDGNPEVPFTYNEKTIEEVKGHIRALLTLAMKAEIRPLFGASMQSDRQFQGFMKRVQYG
jgi:hypothetical protein